MVYVDDAFLSFRHMKMCHMLADTPEELLDMAKKLGLNPNWIQHKGTYKEHFDVSKVKRKLAVELGAKEISMHELGGIIVARRLNENPGESLE